MELITRAIYQILHLLGCPEEDMEYLNNSADVCRKCQRLRFNFRR